MPKAEALKMKYTVEEEFTTWDAIRNQTHEYVYVKTQLTNVPFLKGIALITIGFQNFWRQ